jgi:hypothetical protein
MSPAVSLQYFSATRRLVAVPARLGVETVLVYLNNSDPLPNLEETLHIRCCPNQSYLLEIANMKYEGNLAELEEVLYEWALSEGWLD